MLLENSPWQCVENLGRLGVRAPENTLDSMHTTLARIGATGSIAVEARVRVGGKNRAELTGRLTEGITARDAAKLLPNVTRKFITAAKARENDTPSYPHLGKTMPRIRPRRKFRQCKPHCTSTLNFQKHHRGQKRSGAAYQKPHFD